MRRWWKRLKEITHALAERLDVVGLMNVQYAVQNGVIYLIEVNPGLPGRFPLSPKPSIVPWPRSLLW